MTKAVVLTTVHPAYDGRIYYKQCRTLKRAGYDVELIAPEPEEYEDQEVPIIPLPKAGSRLSRLLLSLKAVKIARKQNGDIYHFHDPELLPAGVLLRILTRKPVVFDVHEHYPNAIMSKPYLSKPARVMMKKVFEMTEKVLLPFLSGIVVTTEEIGERYRKYKHCKVENYPLNELFPAPDLSKKDATQLVYVGGITEIRGAAELIEGFAKVVKARPDAHLTFVGFFQSAEFEKRIMELINSLEIEDHVTFTGKVSYQKVHEYLEHSSIGLLPYLPVPNHVVCLPNKLFEYMATGLAVVSSDFPNYRKVVTDYQTGELVNPESPEEIAGGMLKLMEDEKELKEIQKRALKAFEESYSWKSEGRVLLRFYEELLSKQKK
ncbi:glycosyltransferase family 4 protein [Bacillus sp. FJAT-44742]|uniref:glycosyltransferase family 4 protein n=1 Tax=Bacillus sp. FJAT-44742 TaxID=2014005 RepID=UPI0018E26C03|nr:glycosyltransferase family 4 protein [Bacillus sp. FJAT-44742]